MEAAGVASSKLTSSSSTTPASRTRESLEVVEEAVVRDEKCAAQHMQFVGSTPVGAISGGSGKQQADVKQQHDTYNQDTCWCQQWQDVIRSMSLLSPRCAPSKASHLSKKRHLTRLPGSATLSRAMHRSLNCPLVGSKARQSLRKCSSSTSTPLLHMHHADTTTCHHPPDLLTPTPPDSVSTTAPVEKSGFDRLPASALFSSAMHRSLRDSVGRFDTSKLKPSCSTSAPDARYSAMCAFD